MLQAPSLIYSSRDKLLSKSSKVRGIEHMRISTRSEPCSATKEAKSDAHDGFGASRVLLTHQSKYILSGPSCRAEPGSGSLRVQIPTFQCTKSKDRYVSSPFGFSPAEKKEKKKLITIGFQRFEKHTDLQRLIKGAGESKIKILDAGTSNRGAIRSSSNG